MSKVVLEYFMVEITGIDLLQTDGRSGRVYFSAPKLDEINQVALKPPSRLICFAFSELISLIGTIHISNSSSGRLKGFSYTC